MYRLRDPKMCSQIKFGIPRMYARGHEFSRSDGSGKGARRSMTLNALRHEFWHSCLK